MSYSNAFVGVAILAGGASSRMGEPKLLLPWGATSIIGSLIDQWTRLEVGQVVVVLSRQDQRLMMELDRIGFLRRDMIPNHRPERGMFSSIQAAASWDGWRSGVVHWAIALGDQPHLRDSTLQQVMAAAAANPESVCQPARSGRGGHPVVLPKKLWTQLPGSMVDSLKDFLADQDSVRVNIDDPGLHVDIDTPEDYRAALAKFPPAAVESRG